MLKVTSLFRTNISIYSVQRLLISKHQYLHRISPCARFHTITSLSSQFETAQPNKSNMTKKPAEDQVGYKHIGAEDGSFKRQISSFRSWISSEPGAEFPPEKDRYASSQYFPSQIAKTNLRKRFIDTSPGSLHQSRMSVGIKSKSRSDVERT